METQLHTPNYSIEHHHPLPQIPITLHQRYRYKRLIPPSIHRILHALHVYSLVFLGIKSFASKFCRYLIVGVKSIQIRLSSLFPSIILYLSILYNVLPHLLIRKNQQLIYTKRRKKSEKKKRTSLGKFLPFVFNVVTPINIPVTSLCLFVYFFF